MQTNFKPRQIEIIEAAKNLINQGGIQYATIKNIANEIGVTEPALYRHFNSKIDILSAMLTYFRLQLKELLAETMQSELSSIEKIKKLIQKQFAYFATNPSIVMVIFSESSFQNDQKLSEEVAATIQQKTDAMEKIVLAGQKEGSIRSDVSVSSLATMILGSMRFTILRWRLSAFSFDIELEGLNLGNSIAVLLQSEK